MPLRTVKSNIVQSIRAHRVADLQAAATELGHHFSVRQLGRCPVQARRAGHHCCGIQTARAFW